MKNSRSNSASDITKTCETENYDAGDRKEMISTIKLRPGQIPNFKFSGFCQEVLRKISNLPAQFSDDEDELQINWLPDPCFVHLDSMNYQTPKISFLPNKPITLFKHLKQ